MRCPWVVTIAMSVLSAGCGGEVPTLTGQVVDLWGAPVAGALVLMEGAGNHRTRTDANGRYTLERVEGEHRFRAGHKEFIQGDSVFTVTADSSSGPNFKLYRRAANAGFFVIGVGQYTAITPEPVIAKGTEYKTVYGVKSDGVDIEDSKPTILFHTGLSPEQIQQVDLELRKLTYVDEQALPGLLGEDTVAQIELFLPTSEVVPVDIATTGSRSDFLITPKAELAPGAYVFHTLGLMNPDQDLEAFTRFPMSHRQAWPFAVVK